MDVEMNSVKYFWCRPCVVEASSLILLPQFKWRETRGFLVPAYPHCVWGDERDFGPWVSSLCLGHGS